MNYIERQKKKCEYKTGSPIPKNQYQSQCCENEIEIQIKLKRKWTVKLYHKYSTNVWLRKKTSTSLVNVDDRGGSFIWNEITLSTILHAKVKKLFWSKCKLQIGIMSRQIDDRSIENNQLEKEMFRRVMFTPLILKGK